MSTPQPADEVAVIETSQGRMVLEFWPDVAPKTVENFKKLATQGFYDASFLDRQYTAFGKLVQGDEVLGKLGDVPTRVAGGGERSRPVERQDVTSIKIVSRASLD